MQLQETALMRHLLHLHRHCHDDFLWLTACMSLPTGCDADPVESYLACSDNTDAALRRTLTKAEVRARMP
jgi:hypothetical protein